MRGSAGEKEWQVARSEGEREGLDDVAGGRATRQALLMASARCQRAAFVANLDTAWSVCVDDSTISGNDYINLSINPNQGNYYVGCYNPTPLKKSRPEI